MKHLIIAIDGPVGSGKSSVARRVAELLGYTYLDSGAMYRALALKVLRQGTPLDAADKLEALARDTHIDLQATPGPAAQGIRVLLDGKDVSAAIRGPEISQASSKIAVIARVRQVLVAEQRRAGHSGGVVMEGRDIGTVVFPDADLKLFLDASVEVRAERRWRELHQKGEAMDLRRMVEEVRERDRRDRTRTASPLVRAADAVLVDNTAMDIEETARLIVLLARERENAAMPASASSPHPKS